MNGLEQLQEIGAQRIADTTHIPIAHVENLLHEKYDGFQKPQFFGFLSILEREFKVDLSEVRQAYFSLKNEGPVTVEKHVQPVQSEPSLSVKREKIFKNRKLMYIALAVVAAVGLITAASMLDISPSKEEKIEINNTAIDQAKKNLNIVVKDISDVEAEMANSDVESAEFGQEEISSPTKKVTTTKEQAVNRHEPVASTEPIMPLYLRIVPKGKLWLGLVDTETHRKRVETISKPLLLDAEKTWLIVTGYGHLDVDCGDTTNKYREDRKILILYEAGICQIIDKEEFKARNRGKLW